MKFEQALGMAEDLASDEGEEVNELDVFIEVDGVKTDIVDVAIEEGDDGNLTIVFRDYDPVEEALRPKGAPKNASGK